MPGNFQHKLLQFEISPPKETWKKIADQLDEEYEPGDIVISKKMDQYQIDPPPFIFDRILAGINPDKLSKRPARILTLPLKPITVAAITIGLIILTFVYFLNPESQTNGNSTANILPTVPRTNPGSPSELDNKSNVQPPTPNAIESQALNRAADPKTVLANSQNYRAVKHVNLKPVLATSQISNISVTAPPIFDGNGNIIMDENLVSAPDENYIIVTSPNGEQTKISRKFLKMLCVMNGGSDNNYMNAENFEWKIRFEEWRSKLLQQASYIPTANNFLDIMDLKELLQDN